MSRFALGAHGRRRARGSWRVSCLLLVSLALLLPAARSWAAKEVPVLAGRVNDLADIVPAPVRERIETKLRELERRAGAQIAVLTVDSLEGDSIED